MEPDLTPEIDLLKGLVGARGAAVVQYIQDRHRRRQAKYLDEVREGTGLSGEELFHALTGDEELLELLEAGRRASEETADDNKIRRLARVVAQAITDRTKIDGSRLRLQTLRELEEQHVHALAVLADIAERRQQPDPVAAMVQANTRFRGPRRGTQTGAAFVIGQQLGTNADAADAIAAALQRHGLIWNDPPGFGEWGLTSYGREIVGYLRSLDAQDSSGP